MDVTNQSSSTETASFLFDEVNSDLIESGVNSDLIDNESTNGESATMDHVHDSMEKDREVILKTILEQELQTICKSLVCKFNICRNNIWEGTKRSMLSKSFSPSNKISVKFTGPMREFMTLVLEYLMDSKLFNGSRNSKLLSCSSRCLKESEYFFAGQLIPLYMLVLGHVVSVQFCLNV